MQCTYYSKHGVQYDENRGIVYPTFQIDWEPWQVHNIPELANWPNITDPINLKLLATYVYLKTGHDISWNYKINRSSTLSLYVPSLSLGLYIPDLTKTVSYESIKSERNRLHNALRVKLPQKTKSNVYIIHPTHRPNKHNAYWKSTTWLKKELT